MAKQTVHNKCRCTLLNGKDVCKGKDLLTECDNWSRQLNIQNVTKGCLDTKAVWAKNEDNLKTLVMAQPKIDDRYSDVRIEQDYILKMDTRIWFRRRSRMTLRIKANRSSVFRGNMGCRYCETDLTENQEHLEICAGLTHEQMGLNLNEDMGKQIFWRRMAPKLKKLAGEEKIKRTERKTQT